MQGRKHDALTLRFGRGKFYRRCKCRFLLYRRRAMGTEGVFGFFQSRKTACGGCGVAGLLVIAVTIVILTVRILLDDDMLIIRVIPGNNRCGGFFLRSFGICHDLPYKRVIV